MEGRTSKCTTHLEDYQYHMYTAYVSNQWDPSITKFQSSVESPYNALLYLRVMEKILIEVAYLLSRKPSSDLFQTLQATWEWKHSRGRPWVFRRPSSSSSNKDSLLKKYLTAKKNPTADNPSPFTIGSIFQKIFLPLTPFYQDTSNFHFRGRK